MIHHGQSHVSTSPQLFGGGFGSLIVLLTRFRFPAAGFGLFLSVPDGVLDDDPDVLVAASAVELVPASYEAVSVQSW